jgi:hypothetical protein
VGHGLDAVAPAQLAHDAAAHLPRRVAPLSVGLGVLQAQGQPRQERSVVSGAQVCSDLDLVVRDASDPTRPVPGVTALREAFRDSLIPIVVDVHDWAALPPA